jgi:hypothetical protein
MGGEVEEGQVGGLGRVGKGRGGEGGRGRVVIHTSPGEANKLGIFLILINSLEVQGQVLSKL